MLKVAVLGFGIVGSGVVEVVNGNSANINKKSGVDIHVAKILDVRDFPESPYRGLMTKDAEEIFNDPSIHVVVETIGGSGIAFEFTKRALQSGRHVVTSNKELVAKHGPLLMKMAGENGVSYHFEASVGGGIPIVRPLNNCLAANDIHEIVAILNGTTNYILTQMRDEGKDFNTALKEAQGKGYAEADPTADIDGHDACRKIAILSSIAYNEFVDYEKIHTEGIRNISQEDIRYAEELDAVIKLIAISRKSGDSVSARVSPVLVPKSHQLAKVDNVFNAIFVKGNAIGEAMFYGRGAGKLPTASAVVADIIDIAKHLGTNVKGIEYDVLERSSIVDAGEMETAFFVRAGVNDVHSAKIMVREFMGDVEYIKPDPSAGVNELVFITGHAKEGELQKKLAGLLESDPVDKISSTIRLL